MTNKFSMWSRLVSRVLFVFRHFLYTYIYKCVCILHVKEAISASIILFSLLFMRFSGSWPRQNKKTEPREKERERDSRRFTTKFISFWFFIAIFVVAVRGVKPRELGESSLLVRNSLGWRPLRTYEVSGHFLLDKI